MNCHACGHKDCPAAGDPVGGGYPLHSRMAYERLLTTFPQRADARYVNRQREVAR